MASRAPSAWDTDGPTLCHGLAGILQTLAHTDPSIAAAAAAAVTDAFAPTTRFGFQHHDGHNLCDEPGLLTGAAGVALALADHADLPATSDSIRWDCLLNLPSPR